MYHQIVPDSAPAGWVPAGLADPRYGVRLSHFREQMDLLAALRTRVIRLGELLQQDCSGTREPSVILTFDDGYASDLHLVAPVLKERGFPATFFLATDHIGLPGMMSGEAARELGSDRLFSIGSHGGSHRFLSELSAQERAVELFRSLDMIRSLSDCDEVDLSAPGGRTSDSVRRDARRAGFRSLSTSKPGTFDLGTDPYAIPRLPILDRHSIRAFEALLDPSSLSFRIDAAVRTAKNAARAMAAIRTLSFARTLS